MLCNAQLLTKAALHHLNMCHLTAETFSSRITSDGTLSYKAGHCGYQVGKERAQKTEMKGCKRTGRREEEREGRAVDAG